MRLRASLSDASILILLIPKKHKSQTQLKGEDNNFLVKIEYKDHHSYIKKSGKKRVVLTNNFQQLGFLLAGLVAQGLFNCNREVSSMKLATLQGMVRPPAGWSNPNSSSA